MPITKSAKKAMRQSKKRQIANSVVKNEIKKLTKQIQRQLKLTDGGDVKELITKLFSTVDKAAKKNIIHKNKAARIKSLYTARAKTVLGKDLVLPKKNKPAAETK